MRDLDFDALAKTDPDTLLDIACEVIGDLAPLHEQVAVLEATECRSKLDGYGKGIAAGMTDSAARKEGDRQAKEVSATILEIKGRIQFLEETKWLVYRLMDRADARG